MGCSLGRLHSLIMAKFNCIGDCQCESTPPPPECCIASAADAFPGGGFVLTIGSLSLTVPNSAWSWPGRCCIQTGLISLLGISSWEKKCSKQWSYSSEEQFSLRRYARLKPITNLGGPSIILPGCSNCTTNSINEVARETVLLHEDGELYFASAIRPSTIQFRLGKAIRTCYGSPECVYILSATLNYWVHFQNLRSTFKQDKKTSVIYNSCWSLSGPSVNTITRTTGTSRPMCDYYNPGLFSSFWAITRMKVLGSLGGPLTLTSTDDTPTLCDLTPDKVCGSTPSSQTLIVRNNMSTPPIYTQRTTTTTNINVNCDYYGYYTQPSGVVACTEFQSATPNTVVPLTVENIEAGKLQYISDFTEFPTQTFYNTADSSCYKLKPCGPDTVNTGKTVCGVGNTGIDFKMYEEVKKDFITETFDYTSDVRSSPVEHTYTSPTWTLTPL